MGENYISVFGMIWVNAGNIRDKAKTLTYSRRCEALVNFLGLGRFSAFESRRGANQPAELLHLRPLLPKVFTRVSTLGTCAQSKDAIFIESSRKLYVSQRSAISRPARLPAAVHYLPKLNPQVNIFSR